MSEKAKIRIGPVNNVGGVVTELGRVYRLARRSELDMAEVKGLTYLLREIRCAHCGGPIGEPGRDGLPFLTGDSGHTWLHSDCHGDWTAQRRAEAVEALTILGLRPLTETS